MDWKKNRLPIAAVVLAAFVGLAIWTSRSKRAETDASTTEGARPSLPDINKNDIDELEIRKPGQDPVRLVRRDGTWRMAAPVDAQPDQQAIDAALDKLDELEVERVVSTNPANHARLEVDEEHAIRVIAKNGSEVLLDLLIGNTAAGSTMVRQPNEPRVLAVEGSIKYAFNKAVKDWRNKKIIDHDPAHVREITFATADGTWKFIRNSTNEWIQAPGEDAIERFQGTRVQGIVSTLARLRANDFGAPELTAEAAGFGAAEATVTMLVQHPAPAPDAGTAAGPESTATADAGAEATPPAPPPPETVVLRLGHAIEAGDNDHYVQHDGDATVFVVSQHYADKLKPTVASFQQPPPPAGRDGGAAPPPPDEAMMPPGMQMPPGMPMQMPHGMPVPGGGGGNKIPPELMRKIQEQLRQQNRGAPPH